MYIQIALSLMVIVVISNFVDDQAADDRTFSRIRRCNRIADQRKTCSNNYASIYAGIYNYQLYKIRYFHFIFLIYTASCTSNSNCSGNYGVCNSYSALTGPWGRTYDSRSGSFCTQSLTNDLGSCSSLASTSSC